jgi:energy-coupling factor transport system substrate-specific component
LIFIGMAVPFKVMVLIPGLTEVRPVNAIPVVAGLLFGPAGAWGCAIGNLVADLFGTFSIASLFGFIGNFTAAYLPYKIWYMNGKLEAPNVKTNRNLLKFIFISMITSLCVAVILSCWLDILNITWGRSLFLIIFLNDFGFSLFLGLPVFIVLTTDQTEIGTIIPEPFFQGEKELIIKKVLIAVVTVSEIIFSICVCIGIRVMQSWVMFISGIVLDVSVIAFMIKR